MIDIKIGNSFELIKELPNNYIDCVATSPPYWGLRDYKTESIIFDGSPDCEHEWGNLINITKEECCMQRCKDGKREGMVNKLKDVFVNRGSFCQKCNAWKGSLGLEPIPELFIKHLLDFFDSVRLKLKDVGNCFVNLGDTYFASGGSVGDYNEGGLRENQPKWKQSKSKHQFLQPKSLCCIPSRFAWGMIERGWILRNEIIWAKPNHTPESVTDRLTKGHEVIYHFVKQQKYYYDLDSIREPHKTQEKRPPGIVRSREWNYDGKYEGNKLHEDFGSPRARTQRTKFNCNENQNASNLTNSRDYYRNNGLIEGNQFGKNPGDVWTITTQPYSEAHFATFPLELVRKPILAGCPTNGLVLDPFAGSGTVGEFCRNNNRNAILFELNPEYKKLIEDRSLSNVVNFAELFS